MSLLSLVFTVDGDDFSRAGTASSSTKAQLKKLGLPSDIIRRVAIAMYEGEINMVIHANGGTASVEVKEDSIIITLNDVGPGIPDIPKAMEEGFSTATDTVRSLGFGAGMGLPNMKKYTDSIDITSEVGVGTNVIMLINI